MNRIPYVQYFDKSIAVSLDIKASKERARKLNELSRIISTNASDFESTMKCAKFLREVFPDETDLNTMYYSVLANSTKLSKTYATLFGKNLDKLTSIEDTEDLERANDDLQTEIEALTSSINEIYRNKSKIIEGANKKYLQIVGKGILDERKYPKFKETLTYLSNLIENFKTVSTGFRYIENNGELEEIIQSSKKAFSDFNDLNDEINSLHSQIPSVSDEAQAFLNKLEDGSRVLLRDLDVELLTEIKDKCHDLHTKIFVKMM